MSDSFRVLSSQLGTPDIHQMGRYASDDELLDEDSDHGPKRTSTKRRLTGNLCTICSNGNRFTIVTPSVQTNYNSDVGPTVWR